MKWSIDFYNERRHAMAHYTIDASSPTAAVVSARRTVIAEHPPAPARRRATLLERAERSGGQDGSGWVLYRIAREAE